MSGIEEVMKGLDGIEASLGGMKSRITKLEQGGDHSNAALADRLLMLEQRPSRLEGGGGISRKSLGAMAADELMMSGNVELFNKTRSIRIEVKAAGDPVNTTSGRMIVSGGVGVPEGRVLGLQYGLPQSAGAGTAIEYSRYTGTQGAAAQQATEGAAKAPVRPDHSIIAQTAITIAGGFEALIQ